MFYLHLWSIIYFCKNYFKKITNHTPSLDIILNSVNPCICMRTFKKKITIIQIYEFKLYLVLKLQLTHFINHKFLKYVMASQYI